MPDKSDSLTGMPPRRTYDISLPLQTGMAVWPGDTHYRFERNARIDAGDSVNLGSFTMSIHCGTHVDAPYHYDDSGRTTEQLDLNVYVGPAVVIDVIGKETIRVEDLLPYVTTTVPRVLLKTDSWVDKDKFPTSIPLLDSDVPAFLAAHGVVLIGLDLPSVDALDSKDLLIHHALGDGGIHILESLDLREIVPGIYELIALPLPIFGADGSPVRAILREL